MDPFFLSPEIDTDTDEKQDINFTSLILIHHFTALPRHEIVGNWEIRSTVKTMSHVSFVDIDNSYLYCHYY